MMNLTGALQAGYTVQQILNYLGQTFPELGGRIQEAIGAGKSAEQILRYLSNFDGKQLSKLRGNGPSKKVFSSEPNRNPYTEATEAIKERNPIPESLMTAAKAGIAGAGLGAAGYLGRRALQNAPKIAQQIGGLISGRGVPKAPGPQATNAITENMGEVASAIPQSTSQIPSLAKGQKEVLDKTLQELDLSNKIKSLSKNNSPGAIVGILDKYVDQETRKLIQDKSGLPWNEAIKIHAQDFINEESNLSLASITKQFEEGQKLNEKAQTESKAALQPESQKERLALLSDGQVGNLIEERQGIGSVELPNGQIRRQKMDDLHLQPEEVINAVHDLLKIPEAERSAVIAHTSYNPDSKKLYIMYHNGETVEYDDVDEETFSDISHGKHTPKTTGGNIYGVFSPEDIEKSRGASFHNKIRINPKYSKDNEGKTWRYLQRGYDYYKGLRKQSKKRKKTSDD